MSDHKILIVEDEFPIRTMLRYAFEMAGFVVEEAEDVSTAAEKIAQGSPDLILLDWMLPEQSGIAFTKALKEDKVTCDVPVILLTAKAEEDCKVIGLEAGADDYVTKPFSPRELVARVRAVLRRGPCREVGGCLRIGELCVDVTGQQVLIADLPIKLGPLEYRLLYFFVKHPDRVFSRDELLTHVWGGHTYVDERTVDVHIRRLRKHLLPGGYDELIQTVHGSGYRFSTKDYAK